MQAERLDGAMSRSNIAHNTSLPRCLAVKLSRNRFTILGVAVPKPGVEPGYPLRALVPETSAFGQRSATSA